MFEKNPLCDCCKAPNKYQATLWCTNCEKNLCKSCDNSIHSISIFENHKRESVDAKQIIQNCDKQDKNPLCGCCKPPNKSKAIHWCPKCEKNLCESCDNTIHSISIFENHKRESVDANIEQMMNCDKHKNKKVKYYIPETNEFVCSLCVVENVKNINAAIKVEEYFENIKNEFIKKVNALRNATKLELKREKLKEVNKEYEKKILKNEDEIKIISEIILEIKTNELSLMKSIEELKRVDMMNKDKMNDLNNKILKAKIIQLPFRIEYFNKFGSLGSGNGQFNSAYGVAVDSNNNIIVVDTDNQRIQIFDNKGIFLNKFGSKGSENGQFVRPFGVAVDSNNNIIVADTGNHRIQIFDKKGTFLNKFGSNGSEDGQFIKPHKVAVDSNDNIIVADNGNKKIQMFDKKGTFLNKFRNKESGIGQFVRPFGVAVDSNNNIIVAGGNIIQIFNNKGIFLNKFGGQGSGDGQFNNIYGITIDLNDNIIVADYHNHRIQIFDNEGKFLSKFGYLDSGDGNFSPAEVAIDSNNNIIVVDHNSRIQILSIIDVIN